MKANKDNEIEIYYKWSDLDKAHQYFLVCKFSEHRYGNYWINWLWFKLGQQFPTGLPFRLFPFKGYDSTRLIAQYKNPNNADKAVKAIQKHFSKFKK